MNAFVDHRTWLEFSKNAIAGGKLYIGHLITKN